MNDPRHATIAISQATIGGVTAFPSRANACVSPCAKPRRPTGVQLCIARVATGNVAPSPMPTSRRQKNSDMRPPAKPVRIVALAQIRPHRNSVRRGPKRSPIHPPKIWNIRYG